jgi:hypothetical protein
MRDDERQAEQDARIARAVAADSLLRERKAAPQPGRTPADRVEGYAMALLDQLDGSVPRALSAARAAALAAADEVTHPTRWRTAMRAVELCRRAAGLPGHEAAGPPGHEEPAATDAEPQA